MNGRELLIARELRYAYADGRTALDGLDLVLHERERVALVGPNGAGKTSFFLCVLGLLRGYAGDLSVFGLSPAESRDLVEIRRRAGIVFQSADDQVFNASVLEDVAFGLLNRGVAPAEALDRAREALARVGFPADLHDVHPLRLSSGQKRRVALAGILVSDPEVLFLDEPGSDLDPRGKRQLGELLLSLDKTIVMATHDLEFARRLCSRTTVLDAGRVVADGETDALLRDTETMERHGLETPGSLRR